jgi:TolB-like protein/class 3 adenylate cyclase
MITTRRLAAILAADVAGYSRLIGDDEEGTLNRLRSIRTDVIDPKVSEHRGRIVKTTGDGLLVEFTSVVDALRCASEIQTAMAEGNAKITADKRIEFRIGINVGDIVAEDGDIFGDGVNVAARLEGLADPGGICVSARVQEDAAGKLDVSFEDLGEQSLKNIARPIRVYRVRLEGVKSLSTGKPVDAAPVLPLPDKPSIAVLPFQNMSGDPEQEYFADGMVEEIITALSRIRWLFVIARNSSFTYKGQTIDVKRVGRELGVHYILEGSVRKAGRRVRITGQLIDALSGTHLWADRFDGSLEDVFELQDRVALSVAGVIEPTLEAAEVRRSANRPTNDLTAYDLYLRALPHFESWEKDRSIQSLDLLTQAINRDPYYGPAIALAAHCHLHLDTNGWAGNPETNRRQGIELARRALRVAGDDPNVLGHIAFVLGFLGEDIQLSLDLIDRCLALNPSFARGWFWSGALRVYAGLHDLALEHFETSLQLSPRERKARYLNGIGMAHFFTHRFHDAASKFLASLEEIPTWATPYRFLASCYAHMGRIDEARDIAKRLRAFTSVVMRSDLPFRKLEDRELFLSGLRMAMGEAI